MLIQTETTVKQPRVVVWKILTDPSTWKHWHGGNLKKVEPRWEQGAALHWGMGSPSTVAEFVELQRITLRSPSGLRATFSLSDGGAESTLVEYSEDYTNSTTVVSNFAVRQAACDDTVSGLKQYVESHGRKRWWEFWK